MKKFNRFCLVATLTAPLLLAACMDNDVYDPEKTRPIPPAENPFGSDFNAPDGFDWSMVTSVKLNVEVKDEFNGQYHYLVEVFTTNPLNDATATPIAAGVAKQGDNYVVEITAPKTLEKLYIRQTDPAQRKEVYEFAKTDNMNCKLYISNSNTRATNTRAVTRAETTITDPQYAEPAVPSGATELKDEDYPYGANLTGGTYVISGTFSKSISGNATIYVKGKYNNPANDWTGSITVNSKLIILSGGSVNCGSLTANTGASVQNFGSLTVQSATFQKASELYNAGVIHCTGTLTMQGEDNNGSSLYNHGTLTAQNELITSTSCKVLNTKESILTVNGKFSMQSSQLDNYGKVYAINATKEYDSYSKSIRVNQTTSSIINNYKDALIEATTINGGAAINNYGTMKMNECVSNNSGNILYNNCTFIVTEKLNYRYITLDNGAITGIQEGTQWQPVGTFSVDNNAKVILKNGSIILANIFRPGNPSEFTAEGDAVSMIKANETRYLGNTDFNGLALEPGGEYAATWDGQRGAPIAESNITVNKTNCPSSATDESKYTIETCGGIINEGDEGNTPSEPVIPPVNDATVYTYAFEDQWPVYGDFDMNDVVITIDKRSQTAGNKQVSIQGRIRAVGAGRQVGAGIRLLNVSTDGMTVEKIKTQNAGTYESGQSNPTFILCDNAHKFCKNDNIADNDFTFYCTDPGVSSEYNTGDGANFEITLNFPTVEEADKAMDIKNLDVFIINKAATASSKRTEVHVAGYAPTDLADKTYFGTGNDASSNNTTLNVAAKGYYLSAEGLAWGICIPGNEVWAWPKEKSMITGVYPDFKGWVTSGGTNNLNWYSNHNDNIFVKP